MPEPTATDPAATGPAAHAPLQRTGDEAPGWSAEELSALREDLLEQAATLRREVEAAEAAAVLQRSRTGEGSGDEADAGSTTSERAQEATLADNSRGTLQQVERALSRLDDGTYGRCERCGEEIAKPRLQAFPRATLCLPCKAREERR